MARPRSTIKVVCQNGQCPFYQREKGKDIVKRGINRAGHRQYFCFHCNKYFVETKGTLLYNKKLSERKIVEVCKELVETKGIRATERTTHVHRDTVTRLLNDFGRHANRLHEHLVKDLGLSAYEVDELFTFIKKRRAKTADARIVE